MTLLFVLMLLTIVALTAVCVLVVGLVIRGGPAVLGVLIGEAVARHQEDVMNARLWRLLEQDATLPDGGGVADGRSPSGEVVVATRGGRPW
jgi:hypothetical protein